MSGGKDNALGRGGLSHRRPTALDRFWFGAAYYPEHWTPEVRATDPERMAAAGMNIVRMGEFAWDLMEPREGRFDFSLFDESIARLAEKGVFVIMCTPTATPPRWLTAKHPEFARIDGEGRALRHGSRQHCCISNPLFRRHSRRITRAMAEHFAAAETVVAWQTDNELYCEFSECHCPSCQENFRLWLRAKYGALDALNRAWGTQFWSQTVIEWNDILTPIPGKPTNVNPAQQLDYFRFLDATVTTFQRDQVAILRALKPEWFIFHNGTMPHTDYRGAFTQDLDVLGVDVYPMFEKQSDRRGFQNAFLLDQTRAWSGNFIVPEQQSGQGGQAPYLVGTPEPGEMRMLAYRSIARGADSLMFFRWRTCRFGAEEYWCGILDHDSVPRRRYDEAAQLGRELKKIGPAILGTTIHVDAAVAAADMVTTDAHATYPMGLPWPSDMARIVHRRLYEGGYAVGCVHPSDDLSGIRLYVIPHWAVFDPAWLPNLESFVKSGGTLVIGARTATRDMSNNVVGETLPGVLRGLAGVTVEEYGRQSDPGRVRSLCVGDKTVDTSMWYEVLKCEAARPLYAWKGRHIDGQPAVTVNKVGKGQVVYVGTYLEDAVADALVPALVKMAGLAPALPGLPAGVEAVLREGKGRRVWFFINRGDSAATLASTPKGTDLATGKPSGGALTLERYGVAVIQE